MTALTANKPRAIEGGEINSFPVLGSTKINEGAAVGLQKSTGRARQLVAGDKFVGFARATADNSSGAAGAISVDVYERGKIADLAVSGLVATDLGLPVYASDDDTFSLSPVGGSFIGRVHRCDSAGVGTVVFNATSMQDPLGGLLWEAVSTNKTLDAEDSGKGFWVDTDGVVITMPAVEGIRGVVVMNGGAYGAVGVTVGVNSVDMIEGADITAADNKALINTKATANRGDMVEVEQSDANGWVATRRVGTWARAA